MSYTVGGKGIVEGTIQHGVRGALSADVEIASAEPLTGQQTLKLPGVEFVCTVAEGGVSGLRQHLRLVGGKGGLGRSVKGQHFNSTTVRTVIEYLVGQAGETLATDSDSAILSSRIDHWQHETGTAAQGLDALTEHLGTYWYMKPDGSLRIGEPAWALNEPDHMLLEIDPRAETWTVSALEGTVQPGTTFLGKQVRGVEHTIDGDGARSLVYWGGDDFSIDEDFRDVVRLYQERTLCEYEAEVVTMNADGTVDLQPVSAKDEVGPGWQKVRIALQGLYAVRVQPGAKCVVAFLDNRRDKPYVRQFFPGTQFTSAEMESGAEAARKGDGAGYLYVTTGPLGLGAATVVVNVSWSPTRVIPLPPLTVEYAITITGGSTVVTKVK